MDKENKLKKGKFNSKNRIIMSIVLFLELLFMFRENRLYGLVIFMITISIILIISDKNNQNYDNNDKLIILRDSITSEIKLIKKSTKNLNYDLESANKLDGIIKHLDLISEKYNFIKSNYGEERGMNTLNKLLNELSNLEKNLKKINDKLITLYASEENDKNLNEDLDHIINQLDAQKIL